MTFNMSESLEVRILLLADQDAVTSFEKTKAEATQFDAMEREMQSWSARWRSEALAHYLPQGWSFGAFRAGKLEAYVLAQPFIFFRGLTQTLWIEHVGFASPEAALQVLDVAHRWARDKHLQCVLLEDDPALKTVIQNWPAARPRSLDFIEAKSARY